MSHPTYRQCVFPVRHRRVIGTGPIDRPALDAVSSSPIRGETNDAITTENVARRDDPLHVGCWSHCVVRRRIGESRSRPRSALERPPLCDDQLVLQVQVEPATRFPTCWNSPNIPAR